MANAPIDQNREKGLLVANIVAGTPLPVSGFSLSGVGAAAVAIVDASGAQITSFGGGTQYTDGGTPPTHPVAPTLLFNNAGVWTTISDTNPLPVSASVSVTGVSTATNQTNGSQKTQIVDGAGNVIGATSNALDINIKSGNATTITANAGTNLNTSLLALETGGNLASIKTNTDKIPALGQALAASSVPVVLTAAQIATLTPQTTALTDTQLRASAVPVSLASVPSHPVTNAGTFAVQATLQANSGVDIGKLTANQSVNVAQINGVTPLMGNGVTGTGSQRVTIASDNTAFAVNATLSAETTKVIGTVNIASSQTLATVTTVSTLTNQAQEGGVAISLNAGTVDTGTRRIVQANGAGKTILSLSGSASSSGNNTIVSAGTNKLKVFAFTLSTTSTTAVTVKFQSGASGTDLWSVILQAGTAVSTGANLAVSPPAWIFATASATLLNLNLSSANAVQWSVSYFDEA